MADKGKKVVVLGASDDPERYAYKAAERLKVAGHEVIPVNPRRPLIEGVPALAQLSDVSGAVDTVTVYLSPKRTMALEEDLVRLAPQRVIFNPGAENEALEERLRASGIKTLRACTLVLLSTGQF